MSPIKNHPSMMAAEMPTLTDSALENYQQRTMIQYNKRIVPRLAHTL